MKLWLLPEHPLAWAALRLANLADTVPRSV